MISFSFWPSFDIRHYTYDTDKKNLSLDKGFKEADYFYLNRSVTSNLFL